MHYDEATKNFAKTERQINPSGSYNPVRDLYSLGWKGWQNLPAADFIQELREWDEGFLKDHRDEPFTPVIDISRLVWDGELTLEELRKEQIARFVNADNLFPAEGIAIHRAYAMGAREIRDVILWHMYEEMGHSDVLADNLVNLYGLDRQNDLYRPADELREELLSSATYKFRTNSEDSSPPASYFHAYRDGPLVLAGMYMFQERFAPGPIKRTRESLRRQYGFPSKHLTFWDIHSYIDIYHERLGMYVLGKFATSRDVKEIVMKQLQAGRMKQYEMARDKYERLGPSKK